MIVLGLMIGLLIGIPAGMVFEDLHDIINIKNKDRQDEQN